MWDLVIVGTGHDLARALRSLVRAPGFTLTVSLLLGLGVAATTTLFALVYAVILKPLPYDSPEQLVMVWESNVPRDRLREGPSPGNVEDWVATGDAFDGDELKDKKVTKRIEELASEAIRFGQALHG